MKRRILYKFCSLETKNRRKHVRRMITKRELYFSDPSTFNDPYDCNIGLHLRRLLRPFGVLCFSTEGCDMILMFSYYGNRHRGVCLQFGIDEDDTVGDVAPLFGREVQYQDDLPVFKVHNDIDLQAYMTLITKYKKWQHEKEYRVLMHVEAECDRIRTYTVGQLRGVIFGVHMTPEDQVRLKCWIRKGHHKNVFFKKAQLSKNGFALEFVDF